MSDLGTTSGAKRDTGTASIIHTNTPHLKMKRAGAATSEKESFILSIKWLCKNVLKGILNGKGDTDLDKKRMTYQ